MYVLAAFLVTQINWYLLFSLSLSSHKRAYSMHPCAFQMLNLQNVSSKPYIFDSSPCYWEHGIYIFYYTNSNFVPPRPYGIRRGL